jgi:hypothetical protein
MEEPNILIKTALSEAVQKVNEGMTPTLALKKVANDLDLNPNYIQRTGEALNVALHYKHFKTASDRSTEFEIADIPTVIQDVFSSTEKTAAEYISENFSGNESSDYVFNYNRIASNPVYKRAFLEINDAPDTFESFPTTLTTVYEKSANHVQKMSKLAEEAEVAKVAAELSLNEKFSSLSDEFKRDAGYRTSFDEFESQVYAKHGEASLPYVDLLYKTSRCNEERGVHDKGYMMFEQCKEAAMFDSLMDAAKEYVETEKQAAEAQESLSFESSFLQECKNLMGKKAAKEEETSEKDSKHEKSESAEEEKEEHEPEDPVLQMIKKKASENSLEADNSDPVLKQAMEKEAFFGSMMSIVRGSNMLRDIAHEPVSKSFAHGFESMLTADHKPATPKPNLTLENMERKLLLQELMMTDPILSKVNPAKVARAFEQILRLSPEISKEKEVVRAELRAMVSTQALSKYDAELLTKLDSGMLKRRVATQQYNSGHAENFRF